MMTTAIVTFVLGLLVFLLSLLNQLRRYKNSLLIAALLMFGVSIAAYLNSATVSSPPVTSIPSTSTPEQTVTTPISPVSPVSVPVPAPIEVKASEMNLGGELLFVSNRSNNFEIYKLLIKSFETQQLTDNSGLDIDPDWTPDGKKIAFASNREQGSGFQIYTMGNNGANQARLGELQPGDNSHPVWSPDGKLLAFQSKRDTNGNPQDDNFDIYVMNADGSNITPIITDPADDTEPSWSPDGKLAFLSERSGQDEVYIANIDGTDLQQLTQLNKLKSGLHWSSTGQQIIFTGNGDLYAVNVKTQETTKLLNFGNKNEESPAWGQNENIVFFSSDQTQNWEIYVLDRSDPNSPKIAQLTENESIDRSPAWFSDN